MRKRYCYKIVLDKGDKTFSSFVVTKTSLNYKIGKWTIPTIKNSKIFVFKTLKAARDYRDGWNNDGKILRCEYISLEKTKGLIPHGLMDLKQTIEDFWGDKKVEIYNRIPDGTYFAKKVKPISLCD